MKVMSDQLAAWLPGRLTNLGSDGFGRSNNREQLRRHFENHAESIPAAAQQAILDLGFNPEKQDAQRA